jgi:opacity protein-like surface antigen
MRTRLLFIVVLAMVSLCSSFALALSPMGPPTAGLNQGQFRAGVDYSYCKMDVRMIRGSSPGGGPTFTMNDAINHYLLANLGYGLRDNLELSFRIGGGAARGTDTAGRSFNTASPVPGNGYVIGFGTKATFFEKPDIKWGGLFQLLWAEADAKARAGGSSWTSSIGLWEIQLAAGPTYKLNEKASIYGGPFLHIIDGRFNAYRIGGSGRIHYDLDEGSIFGGYIGTEIKVTSNADFRIEYQHTAAADALGMSLLFKLN